MSGIRHEALLYQGGDGFLAGTVPFVLDGVRSDEPVLVMVGPSKIDAMRSALGPIPDRVRFIDISALGRNPGRILPAWRAFADDAAPGRFRGIGEPVWASRTPEELAECARHEALLNLALHD